MASLRTVAPQAKYGLVKKGNTAVRKPLAAFSNVDDEEEPTDSIRVNKQLQQRAISENKALEKQISAAIEEDPSVFDYDGNYDQMKANIVSSHPLSKPTSSAPKAQYISGLMATAKIRERENDRLYERRLLKERKEEDELFPDQPKFVTGAYKQKLLETKKWEYESNLANELDKHNDVRAKGMQGFFSNLLTKNVSMGLDVDKNAISSFTAGSARQSVLMNEPGPDSDSLPPPSSSASTTSLASSGRLGDCHATAPAHDDSSTDHIVPTIEAPADVDEGNDSGRKRREVHSSDTNDDDQQPTAEKVVTKSKGEEVQDARARYLARKLLRPS